MNQSTKFISEKKFMLDLFYFFIYALFLVPEIQWKTFVQALILLSLGGGGIGISLRRKP